MKSARTESDKRHNSSHWGAFSAEVRGGKVVAVTPFQNDPEPSPILQSLPDAVNSKARITQPMVRAGWLRKGPGGGRDKRGAEPFVPVSWEKALDLVSAELSRVREAHGNQAIYGGSYGWASAGRFHHASSQLWRFLNTIGGFTDDRFSYSVAAGLAVLPHILGSASPFLERGSSWDSIVGNTELMVCFGGLPLRNTQVTPGGPGRHGDGAYQRRAREAGVEFVNVSPFRNDVSDFLEAQNLALRPNTDTALMLGLAHTLVAEDLHDRAFLAKYTAGYDVFESYLMGREDGQPKSADWAAPITEIDAETIRALARRMAARRTMVTTTYSLQRADHGEQPFWMVITLAAMLGQIGLPGGGFAIGYGSMSGKGEPTHKIGAPALPAGINPTNSWIPVARISDMLLHPGESYQFNGETRVYPDIKLVYWCGGNPFHHHQDLNRLLRAWQQPDTVVVHEPFWTATARHADIVLPATTTLERNDLGFSSQDRYIIAMQKLVEPQGGARNDYDIFSDLALRQGSGEAFTEGRDEMEWVRHLYGQFRERAAKQEVELPTFDAFWEKGFTELPLLDEPETQLSGFRYDPAASPLKTPSGRIEIHSRHVACFGYEDCPGHPVWLEPAEWLGGEAARRYPLHMLSTQPSTRLHSQLDCGKTSLASKVQGREPMHMHPQDAARRNLSDGDVARVFNDRGEILAGVVISDHMRPGVVQLPTGAWYDPAEPGTIGSLDKHGNPNVLTMDKGTSQLGQGPSAQSALVEIERYDKPLPEITAFIPPATTEE